MRRFLIIALYSVAILSFLVIAITAVPIGYRLYQHASQVLPLLRADLPAEFEPVASTSSGALFRAEHDGLAGIEICYLYLPIVGSAELSCYRGTSGRVAPRRTPPPQGDS